MAFVDQFFDRHAAQRNGFVPGESERLFNGPAPLLRAQRLALMLFAPRADTLNDELVNGLKMAALDFGLNQLLRFRFDVDRHESTLAHLIITVNLLNQLWELTLQLFHGLLSRFQVFHIYDVVAALYRIGAVAGDAHLDAYATPARHMLRTDLGPAREKRR